MVIIRLKDGQKDILLYETVTTESIDIVTRELVQLKNLVHRVDRLKLAVNDLIQYGPIKPQEELEKIDLENMSLESSDKEDDKGKGKDPTGRRTENPPSADTVQVLKRSMDDLVKSVAPENAAMGNCLRKEDVLEGISTVGGAVKIVYPMDLPEHDPVREILTGKQTSLEVMDEETSALWWAGKQLYRDKLLKDFVGKNERTKIVAKLTKKGSGPPVREAPLDSEAQKQLLSYYYKKQEEQKKLEEDADESHHSAAWANPRSMKEHFLGLGNVSWKPK